MDPPTRPAAKRRAVSMQSNNLSKVPSFASDTSPSPFISNSALNSNSNSITTDTPRPLSRSRLVSVDWTEVEHSDTSSLQIELEECVETKTVTTTTTTKRSYPPLHFQKPSLANLDIKEYPLASRELPMELQKFSYVLDGQVVNRPARRTVSALPTFGSSDARDKVYKSSRSRPHAKVDINRAKRLNQKLSTLQDDRSAKSLIESRSASPMLSGRRLQKTEERASPNILKGLGRHLSTITTFPATPDPPEAESAVNPQTRPRTSFFDQTCTPLSGGSQSSFEEAREGVSTADADSFASAVATPPIAESDLEPLEDSSDNIAHPSAARSVFDSVSAHNASLPSPGLSPTFSASDFEDGTYFDADDLRAARSPASNIEDIQNTSDDEGGLIVSKSRNKGSQERATSFGMSNSEVHTLKETSNMLTMFDAMPAELQSFMMYQFLRRCSRKTLHMVADVVNPALKCDFLDQLPLELSLHILSFLDFRDQCRAAQVSKRWRVIVDTNETGWKELLDRDGFVLPAGELDRAIHQGWGWQDPFGVDGCESDLSVSLGHSSTEVGLKAFKKPEVEPSRRLRSTKRKRGSVINNDRSKRVASEHEFSDKAKCLIGTYAGSGTFHKSEGPFTAASAAAAAVPDPGLGLPSLRTMHLFKSLYRRHRLIQEGWMSGRTAPHHFAFPAHPNHVITCLQFDDDKIITGSDDTLIHVYDTKTGKLRRKLQGHEGGVWALQYEGNVLVSGSTDRSVRVWDIEKGLCTQVFHGHTSTVRCLQILMPELAGYNDKGPVMLPEKPLIITGSRDSHLRVWRLPEQGAKRYIQTGPPANDADCPYFVRALVGHSHSVRAIAAHQDTLVSGSYDNTVRVWKISTGETVHRLHGHSMKVYSVVLDHKRNRCISGSMDNFVKIWSLETGSCLFTLEGHTSLVGLLDLRDERLVSAAADSTLRIWDPENGQCKSTLSAHTGAITCFQHDGQKVISGSDRTLKMWNVKTGECMKDLLTELTGVWQVKFDERRCVAAVQRDNLTFVEVLDFGASRDGIPSNLRGPRQLVRSEEPNLQIGRSIVEEEDGDIEA